MPRLPAAGARPCYQRGMTVSLVTGASRGIGRATALALARRGDRVAVHYRSDREGAEETLAALAGADHVLARADLTDPAETERLVDEVAAAAGPIDVLVNNAGLAPTPGSEHRPDATDYATWRESFLRMLDAGLTAPANLSFLVAQRLIAQGLPGAIVDVGSRGAFRGEPDFPAYGAAKAGLHALNQSLAVALAPHGIAVSSVAPGFIATERQAATLAGPGGDAVRDQSPFGRVGTPDEVAAAIVYLTSPEGRWAAGAVLDLNGASYLR